MNKLVTINVKLEDNFLSTWILPPSKIEDTEVTAHRLSLELNNLKERLKSSEEQTLREMVKFVSLRYYIKESSYMYGLSCNKALVEVESLLMRNKEAVRKYNTLIEQGMSLAEIWRLYD